MAVGVKSADRHIRVSSLSAGLIEFCRIIDLSLNVELIKFPKNARGSFLVPKSFKNGFFFFFFFPLVTWKLLVYGFLQNSKAYTPTTKFLLTKHQTSLNNANENLYAG